MISTSPITDQHQHSTSSTSSGPGSVPIRHNTMTYDPYLGTTTSENNTNRGTSNTGAKVPEFLRPLPKPARYSNNNGESCTPLLPTSTFQSSPIRINGIRPNHQNNSRIPPPPPPQQKYLPPTRPVLEEAVNLVHKREYNNGTQDEYQQRYINNTTSAQQYTPPSHYYTPSSTPIVTHQYTPLYFNNNISQVRPQITTSSNHNNNTITNSTINNNHAYIHIPNSTINTTTLTYSPPKPGQSILKDTIVKPQLLQNNHQLQLHLQQKLPFKVPSGKEGSLKHRILTRPANEHVIGGSGNNKKNRTNNNGPLHPSGAHFARGSLIQLATGELRKIEDMRTEDFISAAEKCPALRLDPSTVVRITENSQRPQEVLITLSYGRTGTQQVELEVSLEHPFFVYGKGWASISPERSLHNFDLPCHRLSVGDICISLSPRPSTPQQQQQQQQGTLPTINNNNSKLSEAARNHIQASAAAAAAAELLRKRRWSAPDQFCSDDENDGPTPSQRTKDNTGF